MLARTPPVHASLVALFAAALVTSCTTLLGDDFEIGPAGSGANAQGGDGASSSGGGHSGGAGGGTGAGGSGGQNPCGNGEPDPGELCDGDCPMECIDEWLCSSDALQGSPDDCSAVCLFEPVDSCIDNDGCCPDGCYNSLDNDCFMRVVIVSNDANGAPSLQAALDTFGVLGAVDLFPADIETPSLGDLQNYDAALVYANYAPFPNPVAMGNVLAQFHDEGGRVVVANGANCEAYPLEGRFVDDGYLVIGMGPFYPGDDWLGVVEVPDTPLLAQAGSVDVVGHCTGPVTPGSTVVARFAETGAPLVAYRWVGERRRVDLNLFPSPPSGVARVVLNALQFQ